jgi:hypothetical protein
MSFQDNKQSLLNFVLRIQKLRDDIISQKKHKIGTVKHLEFTPDVFKVLLDNIKTGNDINQHDYLDRLREPFVCLLISHLTKEDSKIRAKIYETLDHLTKTLHSNAEIQNNMWRCREAIKFIIDVCSPDYLYRFIYKAGTYSENDKIFGSGINWNNLDCISDIVWDLETYKIQNIQSFAERLQVLGDSFLKKNPKYGNDGTVNDTVERNSLESIALYILAAASHLRLMYKDATFNKCITTASEKEKLRIEEE